MDSFRIVYFKNYFAAAFRYGSGTFSFLWFCQIVSYYRHFFPERLFSITFSLQDYMRGGLRLFVAKRFR